MSMMMMSYCRLKEREVTQLLALCFPKQKEIFFHPFVPLS